MARPGLDKNVKFRRLVRLLGEPISHVRGYLECLWDVAYENGNAVIGDADAIAMACHYPGESEKIVTALLECGGPGRSGFIDKLKGKAKGYEVHDLFDHAPHYVKRRHQREQERLAGQRPASGAPLARQRKPVARRRQTTMDLQDESGATPAPAPAPAPTPQPPGPAAPAGELANLWAFHCTRKNRGIVADRAEDKAGEFSEMLRQGADFEALKAAIVNPGRDRNEHLWQFRQRVLPRATGPPAGESFADLTRELEASKPPPPTMEELADRDPFYRKPAE